MIKNKTKFLANLNKAFEMNFIATRGEVEWGAEMLDCLTISMFPITTKEFFIVPSSCYVYIVTKEDDKIKIINSIKVEYYNELSIIVDISCKLNRIINSL